MMLGSVLTIAVEYCAAGSPLGLALFCSSESGEAVLDHSYDFTSLPPTILLNAIHVFWLFFDQLGRALSIVRWFRLIVSEIPDG